MTGKITAPGLTAVKGRGEKIVAITAYDSCFAGLFDEAGVDVILVGDSLANVMLGLPSTVHASLDAMMHHTRAVASSVRRALIVADLPFGSYGASVEQAVKSAADLMKCGASAVKLEGNFPEEVKAIVKTGAPVIGHIGLTPQSVHRFGGYKVQGRGDDGQALVEAALELEEAGASAIVLEVIPAELGKEISKKLRIPTIGIGAGVDCDGEVQVMHDILGLTKEEFKHSKRYIEARQMLSRAVEDYAADVRDRRFPSKDNSF